MIPTNNPHSTAQPNEKANPINCHPACYDAVLDGDFIYTTFVPEIADYPIACKTDDNTHANIPGITNCTKTLLLYLIPSVLTHFFRPECINAHKNPIPLPIAIAAPGL